MRIVAVVLSLLFCANSAFAEETLLEVSWSELQAEGRLTSGELLPPEAGGSYQPLKIANPNGQPLAAEVLTIESPGVTGATYAITGKVRYEGVEGKGYLEMWSFFPDGGPYFSKTLGETGPMKHLRGSSDWRPFTIPFFIGESTMRPEKLLVNVVLPGRGTVFLSPLRLVQYTGGEGVFATPGQWWSNRTAGLIGGLLGAALGCLGGLMWLLSSRGKARAFVMGALKLTIALGGAFLAAGIVALARSQPYAVWVPLVLLGVLCSAIPAGILPAIRRRYEAMELRKMKALDTS